MKKVLNTETITNELRGASVFFPPQKPETVNSEQPITPPPIVIEEPKTLDNETKPPISHAVMPSRSHDGTPSSSHDGMTAQLQERLVADRYTKRKKRAVLALQSIGSQKGTMRLTLEERGLLKSAVYNYEANGINISENEIIRIALNCLLEEDEYPDSGSQLDQIIKELKRGK